MGTALSRWRRRNPLGPLQVRLIGEQADRGEAMTYAGGRRIFDADSHIMELPGWLESYADPADRDKLRPLHLGGAGPMAEEAIRRAEQRKGDASAAKALEDAVLKAKGWNALGAFDPAERSRSLDLLGFERQLVFATFCIGQFAGRDEQLAAIGTRAHNRGIAEFCAGDDRLVGVGWLPLLDPATTAELVDEALAAGCHAFHVPSAPPAELAPTHPSYDPVWARLEEAAAPVLLHLGGQGRMIRKQFHNNDRPVSDFLGGGENVRAKDVMAMHMAPEVWLSAFILDGMLDRFPRLMVGVIEQGAEWVVPWLPRLDRTQSTFAKTEPPVAGLELRASEYVHRNVRVTPFPGERVGWMIEQAGDDIFLFSSDYPHPEGTRDPIARFEAMMENVDDSARRRFYFENLADLLGEKTPVAS